ncbi:probable membrane-associated kinase regulator 2 [Oryza brachyantha]|uniref:probable membrane-associated kinase regulator 2 n=1 Tax=Oryza brachyantha TaxID=4533 RepID=UPI001ADA9067|nr:probable membrane-associated kinase regulator 2 [Oryza brachyantha]
MESFTFLKFLRGGAAAGNRAGAVAATTIAASACEDGGGGGGGEVDDDASFFDLEFAVPGDESAASDAEEERVEFNFSVAGDVESGGEVVAVDDAVAPCGGEPGDAKVVELVSEAAPPPASFLKPATKFRVLLLKLRKPKVPVAAECNGGGSPAPKTNRFLIKFRVDDAPFVSLFTRDNSSRTSDAGAARPAVQVLQPAESAAITAEERRFAKEMLLKYLNKIKPLYVKVSRRYGERLRFAGEETDLEPDSSPSPSPSPSPVSTQPPTAAAAAPAQPVVVACGVRAPRASVPAGLKQVCKRLGKSRSASSAVAAAPSPSPPPPPSAATQHHQQQPQRRDDSLLQLQDGIQSAIAHCKRSFNASKGSESPLLRTMSDPRDGGWADTKDGGGGGGDGGA